MNCKQIDIDKKNFIGVHTSIRNQLMEGEKTLRVVKSEKQMLFDENTYAKLIDFEFEKGTIEVKMLSQLLPDAPVFARGFIGIAFRINEDDSEFEAFYIRPMNALSATDDLIRISHGCQYFAYPRYTFQYFRDHGITKYESPIACGLGEWITIRADIDDTEAKFYLNGEEKPVLIVEKLLHEKRKGALGFFVDIGTEAFFKDLIIKC